MTIIHRMAEFHFWESLAIIKLGLFLLDPVTKHYNVSCCIDCYTFGICAKMRANFQANILQRPVLCMASQGHTRVYSNLLCPLIITHCIFAI